VIKYWELYRTFKNKKKGRGGGRGVVGGDLFIINISRMCKKPML